MPGNKSLNKAKDAKKDEFYTTRQDIEAELCHYAEHFKDKVVYCNCDDPVTSEFWQFFVRNFKPYGLKKLIATHYEPDEKNYAYSLEICEDTNGDGRIDYLDEPTVRQLPCNGDFRSAACIELLKEADIVVTNPPFSLFKEYIAQLVEYEKKFLVIGPLNAIKYKDIFPLFQNEKLWIGYTFPKVFRVPDGTTGTGVYIENGIIYKKFGNIQWYTNLDIPKRHLMLDIRGNYYQKDTYVSYFNYDGIDVPKVNDIPCDYDGNMGVPISYLSDYNPDQFEIIGCSDIPESIPGVDRLGQDWMNHYRAQGGTGHYTANMRSVSVTQPKYKVVFSRLIIRNKNPEPRRYPDED